MIIFWLKGWDPIAHSLAQHLQRIQLKNTNVSSSSIHASSSVIAEQRLLNILTIITDWQSLSTEERRLKSLRTLDVIYNMALGNTTTASGIKSSKTTMVDALESILPITNAVTKRQDNN